VRFTADTCQPGSNFELAYVFEGNILVFDGATCGMRQLTSDGLSNEPAWSPDGERIAFVRHDPLLNGIFVMNSDGSGVARVTGAGQSPTWSPQGDALAFISCTPDCGLYVQELSEGSVPRRIAERGVDPAWSPDGSRIAFFRFHGFLVGGDDTPFYSLRLINADGSGATEIVPVTANMEGATWSPDGTRIAFSVNADIHLVHADGSGLTRLTTYAGAQAPAWSPDGTRIAYWHYEQVGPAHWARIMAIPVDGGEPETLVASGASPSWRPLR
jgi:Tol biopolymer transport system component